MFIVFYFYVIFSTHLRAYTFWETDKHKFKIERYKPCVTGQWISYGLDLRIHNVSAFLCHRKAEVVQKPRSASRLCACTHNIARTGRTWTCISFTAPTVHMPRIPTSLIEETWNLHIFCSDQGAVKWYLQLPGSGIIPDQTRQQFTDWDRVMSFLPLVWVVPVDFLVLRDTTLVAATCTI